MKRSWEATRKRIEEQASCFRRNPLPSVYRPRLSRPGDPAPVWELFPRQAQAFNFVKSCKEGGFTFNDFRHIEQVGRSACYMPAPLTKGVVLKINQKQDVHVFALEHEVGEGQRIYLVTTYVQFWFYYKSRKTLLHCYEVIPENAVCKLYFDLEFNKLANPGADGKKMVALLVEHVCRALQELYGVNCSAKDVFNLDSSTDAKFSRHLIFQLRDVAFKDNIHVGNFVRTVLQPAFPFIASEDDEDAGGAPDTAVPASSRFSEAPAQPGTPCSSSSSTSTEKERGGSRTCGPRGPEGPGPAPPGCPDLSFLVVKNASGKKCLFIDLGVYTRNRNFRLYKSSKIGKRVVLEIAEDNTFSVTQSGDISEENQYFLSSLVSNVRFSDTLRILTCDAPKSKQRQPGHFNSTCTSAENIEGFQDSPYPEIDQFVLSLVNKNGIKGGIRCWNYFFREQLLVYDICKYRWCENIGRAHKSNNIMIVVDLKNEVWYQKCHDPECQAVNFKSDCAPLPGQVCLSFLLEEEEESATDGAMNSEPKNPQKPPSCMLSKTEFSGPDWDNGMDDTCFLEATEDAELAEAAETSLLDRNSGGGEIPDELIVEVCRNS